MTSNFDFTLSGIIHSYDSILNHLGKDWFEENLAAFQSKLPKKDPSGIKRLYHRIDHPLVEWYLLFPDWLQEAKKTFPVPLSEPIINLAILGQSLQMISSDKKFGRLVARLKDPNDFYATAFEIEVAAAHMVQGCNVEFIEEIDTQTPDLYITDNAGNSFWVECKNREIANDKQTEFLWQQVEKYLLQYLRQNKLSYQIALVAKEDLIPTDVTLIKSFIIDTIEHQFEPKSLLRLPGASLSATDETEKFDVEIYKLAEPDVEIDSNEFILPMSRDKADLGIYICDRRELARGKVNISNPRSIHISFANSARIQSVSSAFQSAVTQLPESGPGVIHIRLPLNSWSGNLQETMSHIEEELRKKMSYGLNTRVNAVVVSIYYTRLGEDGSFQNTEYEPYRIVVEHKNPKS